jgi:hypothetical protein
VAVDCRFKYRQRQENSACPPETALASKPLQDLRDDDRNNCQIVFFLEGKVETHYVRGGGSVEEVRPGIRIDDDHRSSAGGASGTPTADIAFPAELALEAAQGTIEAAFLYQTTEGYVHDFSLGVSPGQSHRLLDEFVIDLDVRACHVWVSSNYTPIYVSVVYEARTVLPQREVV